MSLFLKLVAYQFAASVLGTQVDPDSSPERNAAALFFGIVRTGAQDELLASQKRQLTVFSQLDIFYQVVLCDEPSPASTAPAAPCIPSLPTVSRPIPARPASAGPSQANSAPPRRAVYGPRSSPYWLNRRVLRPRVTDLPPVETPPPPAAEDHNQVTTDEG